MTDTQDFNRQNDHEQSGRTGMLICAIIGLSFLWTGCGYLSWMYRLTDFYDSSLVDIMTEVIGYLFQAAGILLFAVSEKRLLYNTLNRYSFPLLTITGLILCCLAVLSSSGPVALIFGYSMNLVFGMIGAYYLTLLSSFVEPGRAGIVFGSSYAISSIISYFLSLIERGSFLKDMRVLLVYVLISGISVIVVRELRNHLQSRIVRYEAEIDIPKAKPGYSRSTVLFAGITVMLLSCVKGAGFFFPSSDMTGHLISLEFSRAFYAAGLVTAGLVNDRKRSAGAILCIAALVFPFFSLAAGSDGSASYLMWILGYVFFGFYTVYRVLVFTDIAGKSPSTIYLAPMGLLWGRLGDASGSLLGILFVDNTIILVSLVAVLFVICIFMFFSLYHILYMKTGQADRDYIRLFASDYDLSQRELDILRLIIAGASNKEIANKLFISENTVKFHVRNLLRKTGCTRRKELQALYSSYLSALD